MTEIQDANDRFNTLWEEIGAKRMTIGDENDGVEIVIDEDLSIFTILDKLKEESELSHSKGELSSEDLQAVKKGADAIKEVLDGGGHYRFGDHFKRLIHK
ncbi:MAG: hypothetical protein KGZ30_02350 [Anaplasmataceae bacterium]|nr:hypothetical protein [Anaplasmataceae bacterium]